MGGYSSRSFPALGGYSVNYGKSAFWWTAIRHWVWTCIEMHFESQQQLGSTRDNHFISFHIFKEGGPRVTNDFQGALHLHYTQTK